MARNDRVRICTFVLLALLGITNYSRLFPVEWAWPYLFPLERWTWVELAAYFSAAALIIGMPRLISKRPDYHDRQMAFFFAKHLQQFYDWSAAPLTLTVEKFLGLNEEVLRKYASAILVCGATLIIKKQEEIEKANPSVRDGEGKELREELGKLEEEFHLRFNLLRTLGVTSANYRPYFEEAKKENLQPAA